MTLLAYTGLADARVLEARDLKTVGVEGFTKKTFRAGEAIEVDDEVATAIIEHPEVFGRGFTIVEDVEGVPETPARSVAAEDLQQTLDEAPSPTTEQEALELRADAPQPVKKKSR